MQVEIAAEAMTSVLSEAAASPGLEVCGLLFGRSGRIDAVQPTANVAADPSCMFEIAPAALFAALRTARAGGAQLIGHYHSHPTGVAEPSAADRAAAEPGKLWLIVADRTARLWLARSADFVEVEIAVMP